MVRVGVLALQGDYEAHSRSLSVLGHQAVEVKRPKHLTDVAALVLPGGESSTMLRLLASEDLLEPLAAFCRSGKPVFGTCAGAILLAKNVSGPDQPSLGLIDMDVERNGYGRQRDSFIAELAADDNALAGVEGVFIRAPIIRRTGPGVSVLLQHDGLPVLVRQGSVWAATFHPEMTTDGRIYQRVLAGSAL